MDKTEENIYGKIENLVSDSYKGLVKVVNSTRGKAIALGLVGVLSLELSGCIFYALKKYKAGDIIKGRATAGQYGYFAIDVLSVGLVVGGVAAAGGGGGGGGGGDGGQNPGPEPPF